MKLNFKKNQTAFKVPAEGFHTGFITDYQVPFEAEDMNGNKYMATRYMIETDEFTNDGKKRLVCLSKTIRLDSLHPKSNLYALASAALNKKDIVESDVPSLETLLYKHIDVVIKHNENNGKVYANVVNVLAHTKSDTADWKSTYEAWESSATADAAKTDAKAEEAAEAVAK